MTTNYALRAVGYLATLEPGEKADSQVIADSTNVPRRFLLKILNDLKSKKILGAARGIGGGFWLAKDASEINLFEIVDIFENLERLEVCPLGGLECSNLPKCPLHNGWGEVRTNYMKFLKGTTFDSFKGVTLFGRFSESD
jgi:Rrf2 family protein